MASFYIFSKACYLHKDYIKLLEEIFPKPPARSRRWGFSPLFSFPLRQQQNKLPLVIPSRCGRASSFSSFCRKGKKKKYQHVSFCILFVHGNFFPRPYEMIYFLFFFPHINIITLYYPLRSVWDRRRLQNKVFRCSSKVSNAHNCHIYSEVPFTAIN